MDPVKIGKFIAGLRRSEGLTQQALGERLGVTNKTVSRWENGNYMPDIAMLPLLADVLKVSVRELLAGEKLSDGDVRQKADKNGMAVSKEGAFSLEERKVYFRRKWRKEHISLFVILILIFAASVVLPFVWDKPYLAGLAPAIAWLEYGYQNNRMMIYVEHSLYS